jgi:hypothetical protein
MLCVLFWTRDEDIVCGFREESLALPVGMEVDMNIVAWGGAHENAECKLNQRTIGRIHMADDRERNQGMKQGTGEGSGQHAPGRNPQDDRSAGGQQGGEQKGGQQRDDFDPNRGEVGIEKEGGQNEQTRR